MGRFAQTLGLMLLLLLAQLTQAEVNASVDRSRVGEMESIELTIRSERTLRASDPDLAVLKQDFEVLGNSQNTNISIINGQQNSFTEWHISLLPKRSGELQIPAIAVGSEHTRPIAITVLKEVSSNRSSDEEVLLEIETDLDETHVQQQVLLTVRLLHAINLGRGASLDEPEIGNSVIRKLGETSYEKMRNGRRYGVFERRYAVFPQTSGELVIPALRFEASIGGGAAWFDQFNNRGRMLRLRSQETRIRVLPPEAGASPWLPARVLTLMETWDKSPQQLQVGESATRTVMITADGLTAAQLPPLPQPTLKGLRFYPDKPTTEDTQSDTGITGTRTESMAVIPTEAGNIEFPELRLRWWDTAKQRFEEAVIPGKTIRVLPANAANAANDLSSSAPEQANEPAATIVKDMPQQPIAPSARPWAWISSTLLLALSTLYCSWGWWRLAHRAQMPIDIKRQPDPREQSAFAALRHACRAGNAAQVEQLLPAWARLMFPERRILSIGDLITISADTELGKQLQTLLAARYAPLPAQHSWDGNPLLQQMEELRKKGRRKNGSDPIADLPPLYA